MLTVGQAGTSTGLTSSKKNSAFGQAVAFTATVSPVAPGSGTPTGTVSFYDGATLLATVNLVNGVATFTISTLAKGTHNIKAVYNGDLDFLMSSFNCADRDDYLRDSSAWLRSIFDLARNLVDATLPLRPLDNASLRPRTS